MVAIDPVVSEEKSFEIVDGRGTDERTTEPAYTISSPKAFGSGELKTGMARRHSNRGWGKLLGETLKKMIDERKMSKQPSLHLLQAQLALL